MLHLFSGSGNLDKAFEDLGWEVDSVDITNGKAFDLSSDEVTRKYKDRAC